MSHQSIPDMFEVEHATQYSGSYTDQILSGSIFDIDDSVYTLFVSYPPPPSNGRKVIAENSRGSKLLTILSSTIQYIESNGFSVPNSYNIGATIYYSHLKNRMCGMNYRFVAPVCQNEIYYDSLIPDPIAIYKLNGGKLVFSNMEDYEFSDDYSYTGSADNPGLDFFFTINNNSKFILAFEDTKVTASNNGTQISDNTWLSSNAFERRYKNVRRLTSAPYINEYVIADEYLTVNSGGNPIEMRYNSSENPLEKYSNGLYGVSGAFLNFPYEVNVEFVIPSSSGGDTVSTRKMHKTAYEIYGTPTGPNFAFITASANALTKLGSTFADQINDPFIKCFYGFGDGLRNIPAFDIEATDHGGTSFYSRGSSPKIRGWKYGLYNGVPTSTRAVFLRGKFGQIRHMLEQRKFTKFYDVKGSGILNEFFGGKIGPTASPVTIKFVSGTNSYVTASIVSAATGALSPTIDLHESGIYDFEYKVGKPFQDT
jgi:hypothetical protein